METQAPGMPPAWMYNAHVASYWRRVFQLFVTMERLSLSMACDATPRDYRMLRLFSASLCAVEIVRSKGVALPISDSAHHMVSVLTPVLQSYGAILGVLNCRTVDGSRYYEPVLLDNQS